ncbi:MAG TPA: hypothetical protein VGZ22_25000 [Isosphaeraceae bacterium]|nr:hypothetical protein [Isosphaeraceae bacterium]
MLIDRKNFPMHRPWVIFLVVATVAASVWYFLELARTGQWPGGSSLPGFVFGVLGGVIILFEALLWLRKKARAYRLGRVQDWMKAHIWLGLLSVPLLFYHSGFRRGGDLGLVLMVVFLIVIASGVWGLMLQQFLPRRMLEDVPAETIYSQIGFVVSQYHKEAAQVVLATCGPAEGEGADRDATGIDLTEHLVVDTLRSVGMVSGRVLKTLTPGARVEGSEPLRLFFKQVVSPFLQGGSVAGSPLRSASRSAALFRDLRTKLDPAAHGAVEMLEVLCDQRRQLDVEARLHLWLHGWLWVHLPLTAVLLVLMFVHIWMALKYW